MVGGGSGVNRNFSLCVADQKFFVV